MQPLPSDPGHPLLSSLREVLQFYPDIARDSRPLQLATGGFSGAVVVQLGQPGTATDPEAAPPMGPAGGGSLLILPAGTEANRPGPPHVSPPPAPRLMCLRRWPQGTSQRRLEALHRFVEWLSRSGPFPLAVTVRNVQGQTITFCGGMWWHVEPWLPGTADFHHKPEPERLRRLMQLLARIHEAAARYQAPPADSQWFGPAAILPSPAVRNRRKLLERWMQQKQDRASDAVRLYAVRSGEAGAARPELTPLAEDTLCRVGRLSLPVLKELKQAENFPVRVSPVLRDIWHDHVLWNNGEVSGLIDLSAAGRESAAADLSRLLGSLAEDDRSLWQLALDEYRLHRRMTPEEEALVPILDRSGVLLSAAGWIDRHYLQNRGSLNLPGAPARLERLATRLDRMLSNSASDF